MTTSPTPQPGPVKLTFTAEWGAIPGGWMLDIGSYTATVAEAGDESGRFSWDIEVRTPSQCTRWSSRGLYDTRNVFADVVEVIRVHAATSRRMSRAANTKSNTKSKLQDDLTRG